MNKPVKMKQLRFSCPVKGTPYENTEVVARGRATKWHFEIDPETGMDDVVVIDEIDFEEEKK